MSLISVSTTWCVSLRWRSFRIVCSNYDFTGTELAHIVKPYTIIKRKGLKIGVFGWCPELTGLVTEANYGCIKYLDPIAKANEMTEIFKKQEKCDVIICISHLGWEIDGVITTTEMAPGTRDIEVLLRWVIAIPTSSSWSIGRTLMAGNRCRSTRTVKALSG